MVLVTTESLASNTFLVIHLRVLLGSLVGIANFASEVSMIKIGINYD